MRLTRSTELMALNICLYVTCHTADQANCFSLPNFTFDLANHGFVYAAQKKKKHSAISNQLNSSRKDPEKPLPKAFPFHIPVSVRITCAVCSSDRPSSKAQGWPKSKKKMKEG